MKTKQKKLSPSFLIFTFIFLMSCQVQRDKSIDVAVGGGMTTVSSVTSHPEEPSDLEELEQFARTFKQRRIKLGFTQVNRSQTCVGSKVSLLVLTHVKQFLLNLFHRGT